MDENALKSLSKGQKDSLATYVRNTAGLPEQQAVLQNSIKAEIAISEAFANADKGKLEQLSRKGVADGFKDVKEYLLGEIQKSVEKSGNKWTGDMASEIEKKIDKHFKQNFKPNKD